MPRVWRVPQWIKDQYDSGAVQRGYAMVKNHGGRPGFVKLIWRDSYKVEGREGKDMIVTMEIDGKKYQFDSQELMYWIKYV